MMANLHFVEGPVRMGFIQTWSTEADSVKWEIRCESVDPNGQGTMCHLLKKTDSEVALRALRGRLVGENRLENAKQAVCELHAEEVMYGLLRKNVLLQLQRDGMPGLRIARVEKAFHAVKRGEANSASTDEKKIMLAIRAALSDAASHPTPAKWVDEE